LRVNPIVIFGQWSSRVGLDSCPTDLSQISRSMAQVFSVQCCVCMKSSCYAFLALNSGKEKGVWMRYTLSPWPNVMSSPSAPSPPYTSAVHRDDPRLSHSCFLFLSLKTHGWVQELYSIQSWCAYFESSPDQSICQSGTSHVNYGQNMLYFIPNFIIMICGCSMSLTLNTDLIILVSLKRYVILTLMLCYMYSTLLICFLFIVC
jgi:hypothetical protein